MLLAVSAPQLAAAPRPAIVQKRIPFPAGRKHEMARYARRHYGIDDYHLRNPKVIVEHVTVTTTYRSAWNTFAADVPDAELHELPGTCAHFIVDRAGRIHQLVSLRYMCRHTVGLNYTAIGIEHVGMSDADVLGDAKQMRASLRLTRWLRCRFGLRVPRVIGHAESLSSPFYRELDPRFKGRTHADWRHRYMQRYRRKLANLGACP